MLLILECKLDSDCNQLYPSCGSGTCHSKILVFLEISYVVQNIKCYIISWIFAFFIPFRISDLTGYIKLNQKQCYRGKYGTYSTLDAAINACEGDSNCGGVYDQGCDAGANDIFLCASSTKYGFAETSCIYEKNEVGK